MRSSRDRLSDVAGTTKRRRSNDCRHRPGDPATCRGDALAIVAPALPTSSRDRWSDVAPVLPTSSRDRRRDVALALPTCRSGIPNMSLQRLYDLRCDVTQGNCRLNGPMARFRSNCRSLRLGDSYNPPTPSEHRLCILSSTQT